MTLTRHGTVACPALSEIIVFFRGRTGACNSCSFCTVSAARRRVLIIFLPGVSLFVTATGRSGTRNNKLIPNPLHDRKQVPRERCLLAFEHGGLDVEEMLV